MSKLRDPGVQYWTIRTSRSGLRMDRAGAAVTVPRLQIGILRVRPMVAEKAGAAGRGTPKDSLHVQAGAN